MTAADATAPRAAWPPTAQRRGALAAAVLLWLHVDFYLDTRLQSLVIDVLGVTPWTQFVAETAHFGCALLALPLLGPGALRQVFGSRPAPAAMVAGMVAALVAAPMFWGYGLLLERAGRAPSIGSITSYYCAEYLRLILLGPLAEELLCRGLLWAALRRLASARVAIVVTALVFMLAHGPERVRDFPCLFAFGLMMGVLRHRSGSLSPTILAHSASNLGLLAFFA
jgi:membrane protease YdiL (CAAX protease family)